MKREEGAGLEMMDGEVRTRVHVYIHSGIPLLKGPRHLEGGWENRGMRYRIAC